MNSPNPTPADQSSQLETQPGGSPGGQPPETQQAQQAPGNRSFINNALIGVILVLGTLIVANGVTKSFPGFGVSSPVAVLDSDLITAASVRDLLQRASTMTPAVVEAESKKRADAMQDALADLRRRGYVVIDRSAALSWPESADMTEQIATALEIPPAALQAVRDLRSEQQRLVKAGKTNKFPAATPDAPAKDSSIRGSALD